MYKKSTTKITIEDIIEAAKSADIKCENCENHIKPFLNYPRPEYKDYEECTLIADKFKRDKNSFFCSEFKAKKTI